MQTEPSADNQPLDSEQPPERAPSVRLGSSSAWQFMAQVFVLGTSFVASVLIARSLGPVGKGQLSVLQQVPGTLLVLLNLGLTGANTYFVGTKRTDTETATGNSLLFAAVVGTASFPIVWLMTLGPLGVVEGLNPLPVAIAAATLPFGLAATFVAGISVGQGKLRQMAIAQMLGATVSMTVIVAAYIAGVLALTTAMIAALLALLIGLVFNLRSIMYGAGRLRLSLQALRASSKYSAKSYLSNLAGYLNYRQDILLVGYLAGAGAVGVYSIAVTFAELMWYVPNSVASAIMAKSMREGEQEGAALTARTARMTLVIMLAMSALAVLLIRPVISFFYTDAFLPAWTAFLILLPGVWLIGIAKVLGGYLGAQGRLFPSLSVASALLNLAGNLALVPVLGFNGAAIASSVSYAIPGVLMARHFMRHTHLRISDLVLPRSDDWLAVHQALKSYVHSSRRRP